MSAQSALSARQHFLVMALLIAVLAVAALVGAGPLARRAGWSRAATAGALLMAAVCLGLTLPDQITPGVLERLHACVTDSSVRTLDGGAAHNAFNVIAWIPLGALAALASRRPPAVLAAGSLTWAVVELVQTLDPVRSCQPLDWANNTLGIALGVGLAVLLIRRRGPVG